ncbi:diaminopropionate ammonia-lyase [Olsenella sp. oral taxon 809 str. F0356]|uniref:diaminopropionate ammonia-lyase n=1 Tax=Olsenella sp. oral taxon 809 TaxID=661086 RepID=UPI000231F2A2|nr:diaminopropionate ammonia-lyase [Olsenella sp. oral taxon 809]EHF02543.1 diaminopropionate ammonia-lyase [Olsenella sp. oral taxon 809 str. F0356]
MEPKIKWVANGMPKSEDVNLPVMSLDNVAKARAFHGSFPQYSVTPLANLAGMAERLGLGGLFVKDESYRFGLNAFKVLGGSFAMARYIADETGRDVSEMTFDYLTSNQLQKDFGQATFFTATDGNHGRGVAWAANKLGQRSVVHMPKGSTKTRFDNIAKEGAKVTIEELNYDDCVRLAAKEAAETEHGVIVQDTAWEGYEKIPSWIMQGYGTMAAEAAEQLRQLEVNRPTHVFVQAGVGSLASAMVGYFANLFPSCPPKFVIMEAGVADCLYQGALAGDGDPRIVGGDLQTIMAGLACGEPNTIGWDILRNHADAFLSCPDWVAAKGMRMLAAPTKGDPSVTSGESGAVGMGVISTIMSDPDYAELRDVLELGRDSKVLLFSTEGDTDPVRYREVVWGGAYATE